MLADISPQTPHSCRFCARSARCCAASTARYLQCKGAGNGVITCRLTGRGVGEPSGTANIRYSNSALAQTAQESRSSAGTWHLLHNQPARLP